MTRTTRRSLLTAAAATPLAAPALRAQGTDPFRIGLILPMTGPFASTGRQIDVAVKAWLRANAEPPAGRRFEILLRDDTGVAPDVTRRLAQELVVRERVRQRLEEDVAAVVVAGPPLPLVVVRVDLAQPAATVVGGRLGHRARPRIASRGPPATAQG